MARTDSVTADRNVMEAPTRSLAHTLLWGFTRVFSILALVVAWEGLARSGQFTPFVLPSLSSVIERIWADAISGDLAINTGLTVYRATVGFLADDMLEGRDTGSRGHEIAARYVASRFAELGLTPGGEEGAISLSAK